MTVDLFQTSLHYAAVYDELSANGVTPRPHWAHLMESLREIGPEELGRRWNRAERRIRENGITYNIYSDPLGANRPWKIDIVPLLISADEWRFIEAGIIQRAQLLSLRSRGPLRVAGPRGAGPLSCGAALCKPGISCDHLWVCPFPRTVIFICSPSILRVRRTASGGYWPIARRRLQAADMRWRTAPLSPMFYQISFAPRTYCVSLLSFVRNAKRWPASPSGTLRESYC